MKILFSLIALILLLLSSCESIPPGEPPPDGILAPTITTPVNEKPILNQYEACAAMLASLISKSKVISQASTLNPPPVINEFTASSEGKINFLPMEIWSKLIKMKLIRPQNERTNASYILSSEFLPLDEHNGKKKFLWQMNLKKLSLNTNEEIEWQDEIQFYLDDSH